MEIIGAATEKELTGENVEKKLEREIRADVYYV